VLGLAYAANVDNLQNLVILCPPLTQCERESGGRVYVSDSYRKKQKMDTQSLLVRNIVCGHFTIRARVGA
jgi:hypothetical protein